MAQALLRIFWNAFSSRETHVAGFSGWPAVGNKLYEASLRSCLKAELNLDTDLPLSAVEVSIAETYDRILVRGLTSIVW